jgi:hypothetical protein
VSNLSNYHNLKKSSYFKQIKMSNYSEDPLQAAKQAERKLNSNAAKQGKSTSDSGTPFPF